MKCISLTNLKFIEQNYKYKYNYLLTFSHSNDDNLLINKYHINCSFTHSL